MTLNEIYKNPKGALIYLERYVNDGSPSGFTWINQTSSYTSPISLVPCFNLYELQAGDKTITIGDNTKLQSLVSANNIFVHPDMVEMYNRDKAYIIKSKTKVIATSSFRTVKLLNTDGYIKLNYNGIIGRIDRSLTDKHALASVEMTRFLKEKLNKSIYSYLSFFPESAAKIYVDKKNNYNFGMVYREELPFGINAEDIKFIIPIFSLFSRDKLNPKSEYLLVQLIKNSKKSAERYILEDIIFKIIDNYFSLVIYEGIQPEWHAQNLLIGFDSNFSVKSLIMRDLESIDIDQTIQEKLGIHYKFQSYPYKYLNDKQYNYQIKHSFMYDFKIGEYIFSPIIDIATKYFSVNTNQLYDLIKEYANQYIIKLPENYYPSNRVWFSFEKKIINRSNSIRPYVLNTNAKYRW